MFATLVNVSLKAQNTEYGIEKFVLKIEVFS